MATNDDPATVLEQFIHDVANLPAEIAHHLEEIQAKDQAMVEFRNHISSRDAAIQRHVRNNGGHTKFPQEEKYIAAVKTNYDKAIQMQEEKCMLANKVARLLDRHVKKYDLQIRELINAGVFMPDNSLPSLLEESAGNLAPPASTSGTGTNTPLASHLGIGTGSSSTIADLARARNFPPTIIAPPRAPAVAAAVASMQPAAAATNGAAVVAQRTREGSQGANDPKRRRLLQGATLNIPAQPSNLRQSSQGPSVSTPKATTPGASSSRAGSLGPARTKKAPKKSLPPGGMRKAVAKKQRRLAQGKKGTPSTTESSPSDDDSSDAESNDATSQRRAGKDGADEDEEMEDASGEQDGYDDEGEDNRRYCICSQPSHGDMVACDNENCKLEWFHWGCVGLTAPPKGRWLCPRCKDLPKNQLKLAR